MAYSHMSDILSVVAICLTSHWVEMDAQNCKDGGNGYPCHICRQKSCLPRRTGKSVLDEVMMSTYKVTLLLGWTAVREQSASDICLRPCCVELCRVSKMFSLSRSLMCRISQEVKPGMQPLSVPDI